MSSAKYRTAVHQGALDSLCGIYAIINGIGLIEPRRMSEEDRRDLFIYLTNFFGDGREIGEIIHSGIGFRKLGKLIDAASQRRRDKSGLVIKRRTAMKQVPDDLDDFWSVLEDHVDIEQGRTVILGLGGAHDHWTVIRSVSAKRITLQDSDGLHHLDKRSCGLDAEGDIRHALWSTQSYLLTAEEWVEPEE